MSNVKKEINWKALAEQASKYHEYFEKSITEQTQDLQKMIGHKPTPDALNIWQDIRKVY